MDFEIKPLKGVGAIEFGMTPLEVRNRLGGEFKSFKRSSMAAFPCDYFQSVGIFAYYRASGELEALEFASPAQPVLEGANLLSMSFSAAKAFLSSRDSALENKGDSAIAHAVGVSVYASTAKKNPMTPCESVLVFAPGYYD